MAEPERLSLIATADVGQAVTAIGQLQKSLEGASKSGVDDLEKWRQKGLALGDVLFNVGTTASTAFSLLVGGGAAAGSALAALGTQLNAFGKESEKFQHLAESVGIPVEKLAELQAYADRLGVSGATLASGLKEFAGHMLEIRDHTDAALRFRAELTAAGVVASYQQVEALSHEKDHLKQLETVLSFARQINDVELRRLFLKKWTGQEDIELLARDELRLKTLLQMSGLKVEVADPKKTQEALDQFWILGIRLDNLKVKIMEGVAPAFGRLTKELNDFIAANDKEISQGLIGFFDRLNESVDEAIKIFRLIRPELEWLNKLLDKWGFGTPKKLAPKGTPERAEQDREAEEAGGLFGVTGPLHRALTDIDRYLPKWLTELPGWKQNLPPIINPAEQIQGPKAPPSEPKAEEVPWWRRVLPPGVNPFRPHLPQPYQGLISPEGAAPPEMMGAPMPAHAPLYGGGGFGPSVPSGPPAPSGPPGRQPSPFDIYPTPPPPPRAVAPAPYAEKWKRLPHSTRIEDRRGMGVDEGPMPPLPAPLPIPIGGGSTPLDKLQESVGKYLRQLHPPAGTAPQPIMAPPPQAVGFAGLESVGGGVETGLSILDLLKKRAPVTGLVMKLPELFGSAQEIGPMMLQGNPAERAAELQKWIDIRKLEGKQLPLPEEKLFQVYHLSPKDIGAGIGGRGASGQWTSPPQRPDITMREFLRGAKPEDLLDPLMQRSQLGPTQPDKAPLPLTMEGMQRALRGESQEGRGDVMDWVRSQQIGGEKAAPQEPVGQDFSRNIDKALAAQGGIQKVEGVGRIRVDVNAPRGTMVSASGEGLFKETEMHRSNSLALADDWSS